MRAFLALIVASAMAFGGLAAVSVVLPAVGSPALAAKAKAKRSGHARPAPVRPADHGI